jgi:hypothetical protein
VVAKECAAENAKANANAIHHRDTEDTEKGQSVFIAKAQRKDKNFNRQTQRKRRIYRSRCGVFSRGCSD